MKIAIIGGIGSGKSEVLKVARELGIRTLSADEINSQLLAFPDYIKMLAERFPSAVAQGEVNRKRLAEIVFADENALKALNELSHPRILKRIAEEEAGMLAVEMPLLLEIGAEKLFDLIILVYTPIDMRIERLKVRGLSEDEARRRINAQADEKVLLVAADRIIDNSGTQEELKRNARELFCEIMSTSNGDSQES